MSVVRPYSKAEVESWKARDRAGREPFVLDEIPGWTRTAQPGSLPNERMIRLERGDSSITAIRWWDLPLHPGNPMAIASERKVTIGDREHAIITTSAFEGFNRVVDVVYRRGRDWFARIVFERCTPAEIEDVLARISWSDS